MELISTYATNNTLNHQVRNFWQNIYGVQVGPGARVSIKVWIKYFGFSNFRILRIKSHLKIL